MVSLLCKLATEVMQCVLQAFFFYFGVFLMTKSYFYLIVRIFSVCSRQKFCSIFL